jgi:hypothetical protein
MSANFHKPFLIKIHMIDFISMNKAFMISYVEA